MNRHRRWILAPLIALVLSSPAAASGAAEPHLGRVPLGPRFTLEQLLRHGFDVVEVRGANEARILAWPGDETRLIALGGQFELLDDHPGRTAATLSRQERRASPPTSVSWKGAPGRLGGASTQLGPPPVGSGSMGGYWTTAEIKMKLDALVASDPNDLVSDRIDTLGTTIQGHPVWGLMLGRHRTGPGLPPVAYFSALTHAREPGGMQALFYFVDDLLSRYGTDPFGTYLLEKRRIYIVPLVNPDGYLVNEGTYFGSGGTTFGFWRKNVRDNNGNAVFDSDSDGVDLNRNFGFKWGFDDVGSSPDVTVETYRGPGPFSEPESRIQRDVVASLQPKTGLSFHTYQDLMLFPWGFIPDGAPDSLAFKEWTDLLTRDNAYLGGQSTRTLYSTNGEFNDWTYGDTLLKPRAYTWTPEVGSADDGFWPPPSRIVPLAQENLRACYVVAALAGAFVQTDGWRILEGALNASYGAHLSVRARNLGIAASAGPGLTGTLTPIDAGVRMLVGTVGYPTLGTRQSADPVGGATFEMVVADTVTPGRLVRFRVDFADANGLVSRDTLTIPLGTPTVVAFDNATSGLGKWTPGTWGISSGSVDHPAPYFADSPAGNYSVGANNSFLLNQPLNLTAGVHAYAQYGAHWEFEQDYDAGSIEASRDGTAWTYLNATGTTPGSGISGSVQPAGLPVYAGSRRAWRHEVADLSSFTGATATAIRLRFRVRSDVAVTFDGLGIDSVRVVLFDPAAQPALVAVAGAAPAATVELAGPVPNPTSTGARFEFSVPRAGNVRLSILDLQGRRIRALADGRVEPGRYARRWDLVDGGGRAVAPGVFFALLETPDGTLTRRFAVVR